MSLDQRINLNFLVKLKKRGWSHSKCFRRPTAIKPCLVKVFSSGIGDSGRVRRTNQDLEDIKQWLSPGSPKLKKARQSRPQIKVMLIAFFDARGIVHVEFISQRQTVNQHVYQRVLKNLLAAEDAICLIRTRGCSNHHNAPAHSVLSVCCFLAEKLSQCWTSPPTARI